MCDQSLLLGKLKLEGIAQEDSQACFDFFSFRFRPSEAQKGVIGIANIFESSEVWIVRITSRKGTKLTFHLSGLCVVSFLSQTVNLVFNTMVCRGSLSAFSLCVDRE